MATDKFSLTVNAGIRDVQTHLGGFLAASTATPGANAVTIRRVDAATFELVEHGGEFAEMARILLSEEAAAAATMTTRFVVRSEGRGTRIDVTIAVSPELDGVLEMLIPFAGDVGDALRPSLEDQRAFVARLEAFVADRQAPGAAEGGLA